MNKIVPWIVAIIIVIGGWYVLSHGNPAPAPATNPAPAAQPAQATSSPASVAKQPAGFAVSTATSGALGRYLVDSSGMTLYVFAKDAPNVSNCSGTCAALWPPYLVPSTTSTIAIGPGVVGKVGTITRADGGVQVTYNGQPLYFFKSDTKPGDTSGQGVKGVWSVAKP